MGMSLLHPTSYNCSWQKCLLLTLPTREAAGPWLHPALRCSATKAELKGGRTDGREHLQLSVCREKLSWFSSLPEASVGKRTHRQCGGAGWLPCCVCCKGGRVPLWAGGWHGGASSSSALPTFTLVSLLCDHGTRFADNVTLTLEDGCRFCFSCQFSRRGLGGLERWLSG